MSDPHTTPPLVLGIDTGGTYTDGMLLDYGARQVLATAKSLTTKRDLTIGIEKVIEGIHIEDPASVKMVSVSTTLATNAIAEGKGKRVALLLVGYDPDLIKSFKLAGRFATPNFYYFQASWPKSTPSKARWMRSPYPAISARSIPNTNCGCSER